MNNQPLQKINFSNYRNYKLCAKTNNKLTPKYLSHYECSKFNQPVDKGCLDNLNSLTQLTLGCYFDQELNISFNIKILELDKHYFSDFFTFCSDKSDCLTVFSNLS